MPRSPNIDDLRCKRARSVGCPVQVPAIEATLGGDLNMTDKSAALPEGPHVVIVGGGFAGLAAARELRDTPARVTLIDRSNHHLFQPLLYQVATGALSPANIAAPLRGILRRQTNARVLLGEVIGIDVREQRVRLKQTSVAYDLLVVATGARHYYFGHDDWEALTLGLKTLGDATEMRSRILGAFEAAELADDPARVREWLTFVVVGAGPTGVELADALGEVANDTLRRDFRAIDPSSARILLLEAADQVLPSFPAALAAQAARALMRLGVTVRIETSVTSVERGAVVVSTAEGEERIETHTVLWAAGVQASSLGGLLAAGTGAELDAVGRVRVGSDLSLPGHPELFVIGDLAHVEDASGTLPGVAPVALQQGRYVGRLLRRRLAGQPVGPFQYRDRGRLATVGRGFAIADFGRIRLTGFAGWLAWIGVHLWSVTEFENRVLVFVQWAWSYWTRNRAARLMLGRAPPANGESRRRGPPP